MKNIDINLPQLLMIGDNLKLQVDMASGFADKGLGVSNLPEVHSMLVTGNDLAREIETIPPIEQAEYNIQSIAWSGIEKSQVSEINKNKEQMEIQLKQIERATRFLTTLKSEMATNLHKFKYLSRIMDVRPAIDAESTEKAKRMLNESVLPELERFNDLVVKLKNKYEQEKESRTVRLAEIEMLLHWATKYIFRRLRPKAASAAKEAEKDAKFDVVLDVKADKKKAEEEEEAS